MRKRITSLDTSFDAARVQHEIFRRHGGEERLRAGFEMTETVRPLAMEGIRRRHPDYSDEQVFRALMRLIYGDELFRQAFPGEIVRP